MKKWIVLLAAFILLLSLTACTEEAKPIPGQEAVPEAAPEYSPEETQAVEPEALISVPCLTLRVVHTTDTGFVGAVEEGADSHLRNGTELNIVIEEGVEACYWADETVGNYIDAREVPYEPGMLVIIQYTNNKWIGDTVYPELLDIPYETNIQPMED